MWAVDTSEALEHFAQALRDRGHCVDVLVDAEAGADLLVGGSRGTREVHVNGGTRKPTVSATATAEATTFRFRRRATLVFAPRSAHALQKQKDKIYVHPDGWYADHGIDPHLNETRRSPPSTGTPTR